MEGPGFITIKYGENEESILNTWCPSHLLLKYCLKKCFGEEEAQKYKHLKIDLMDTNGKLGQLPSNPYLYAHNLIDPRETYILIKIERKEDEEDRYISLLHNIGKLYPKVKAKLDELSRYKVSGKVGARWAKVKTISRISSMVKASPRTQDTKTPPLEKRSSSSSVDRLESARSEKSNKSTKKGAKDGAKKKKNTKS